MATPRAAPTAPRPPSRPRVPVLPSLAWDPGSGLVRGVVGRLDRAEPGRHLEQRWIELHEGVLDRGVVTMAAVTRRCRRVRHRRLRKTTVAAEPDVGPTTSRGIDRKSV